MSGRVLEGPKFRFSMEEKTLGTFFFHNVEKYSDQICQIDSSLDGSENYDSVRQKSIRAAISMQNRGITSSSVVAFCAGNSLDNTIPMLAAFYLGAKVTNLERTQSIECIKQVLSLITPKMIFVEESSVRWIEDALASVDFEKEIVVFGQSTKYSFYSDFIKSQKQEHKFRPVKVDQDDVAVVALSSGTDGMPKIICHSHRSFLCLTLRHYQLGIRGNILHLTSFYRLSTLVLMACCFKSGTSRVFSHSTTSENVFKVIEKYTISAIFAGPTLIYSLASFVNTNHFDTSSVKMLMCTGAPLAPSQFKKMNNLFPNGVTILVYAMSELGIATGFDVEVDDNLPKTKLGSCGRPAPLVQLRIVNPDTEEQLGPNQQGEVRIKTPSMMVGYYKSDFSHVFDGQGFLKTGDIGFYDENECVYVAEKIKDMFKYKKTLIIPSVIEAVLLEHPAIKETVVFGLPCGDDDEVPAACVVLKEGYALNEKEINLYLNDRVNDKEKLRGGVTFLSSLPKTPTEKVRRQEVKDLIIKSKGG